MSSCHQGGHSGSAVPTVASATGGVDRHFLDSSQIFFFYKRAGMDMCEVSLKTPFFNGSLVPQRT